ncbi:MAG: dihydropteroate synthase [Isosphaeraceae bacterium]
MPRWEALGRVVVSEHDLAPKIMGVVNVTPDSFSDGGRHPGVAEALAHARHLVEEGADILDVGGESTRPNAEPVPLDEELRRVVPVVEAVSGATDRPISVDTMKAEVARRALAAGASILNDVSALTADPEMLRVAADSGAGVVLMHMPGNPRTMNLDPRYEDVVTEVYDYLARRAEAAERGGVERSRIAIDPGIGFGKLTEHNLLILRNLRRFATLGCVLLIGTSRKGFLGKITGRPVEQRATASVISALSAAVQGAQVVRVHDVGAMSDALKVWTAQGGWASDEPHGARP